jgi:Flp pilus assembly protein TadG
MRSRFRTDPRFDAHSILGSADGSVTAEFAAVVPAVVLLLAIALGGIRLAGEQLQLQAAVQDASRLLARGDPGATSRVLQVVAKANVDDDESGDLVCVHARAPADLGILVGIVLSASACALDERQ